MKVLQFGRFWNDQHGGIERHVALLSRELALQGLDITNLVAADHKQGSDTRVDGYRLVQAPSYGRAFSTAISPALVYKALALHRKYQFDLIHLHLPDPLSHATSLLFPSDVKRVITWHSDIIKQKRLLAIYSPFVRRLLNNADAVIAGTAAHYSSSNQIPDSVPVSRRHVIPYGLDFTGMVLNPQSTLLCERIKQRAAGKQIVLALGRHVYYKGFDVLIDAMRHIDALLIIGSDGPLRPELEAQVAREKLQEKVWFTGRIPEEDLGAYLNACDLFCLPSVEQSEAFGLVQLEAMACGKPVVNTQLFNGVNVVNVDGVTGLTVPVRDASALALAINRLLSDEALRLQLGRQAKERALQEYSLKAMGEKHVALYRSLLE